MAGRNFLFIPGPTNVPERILNAMHISQEDMRAIDFPTFTLPLYQDLKKIFKSKDGQVFIFPASGTGGWEAGITNTLSPGDKVLASGFGHFSNLFIDLCQRHKMDVQALEVDWGEGVPVEKYADILRKDKNTRSRPCSRPITRPRPASPAISLRCARPRRRETPGAAIRRWGQLDREHRFPHGRMGRGRRRLGIAEGLHVADRARHPLFQPESLGGAHEAPNARAVSSTSRT